MDKVFFFSIFSVEIFVHIFLKKKRNKILFMTQMVNVFFQTGITTNKVK